MLCCSAKWRGAQYVDRILVGSTGSGRHMSKNIVTLESKIGVETIRMLRNPGIVNYIKLENVSFPRTTNMGERSTNMSAHFARVKVVFQFILKKNVKMSSIIFQKKNKIGAAQSQ